MDNAVKNKIIVITISIILVAILAVFVASVVALMSNNKNVNNSSLQEVTSSQNVTTSQSCSSTQSSPSSIVSSSKTPSANTPSNKPTVGSSSKPNNHSDNDTSSSNTSSEVKNTFFDKRPEKNIKSFDIKDEFSTPTYQKKIFKDDKSGKEMRYCLYLPENYSASKKYPVLLFMHGLGNVGDNYIGATFGIAPIFKNSADIVKRAIVVAPQASDANGFWPIHNRGNDENGLGGIAMRLLLDIEKTYSCDKNRIYITGNSMGGHGTWNLIETYSDHFAAAIPICGWGDPLNAKKMKNMPIWIYHGDADPTVPVESSRAMYDAIKKAGSTKIHYTELPGVQHDAWTPAYENRELISWMFSQNKATNPGSSYELIPFLKVCDNNENTVISEKDTTLISYTTVSEVDCLELKLTDNGAKKLEAAYKKSSGKTFSVYYGNVKIMNFTATKGSVNKTFYIHGGFNAYNYYEYIDKINSYMK